MGPIAFSDQDEEVVPVTWEKNGSMVGCISHHPQHDTESFCRYVSIDVVAACDDDKDSVEGQISCGNELEVSSTQACRKDDKNCGFREVFDKSEVAGSRACRSIWARGATYTGQTCEDGLAHGRGCLTKPDRSGYIGEFVRGKMHGNGKLTLADGSFYEGDWSQGFRHGTGSEVLVNQGNYDGEYVADKRHGEGSFTWSSGQTYTGQFEMDEVEGHGTFLWIDKRKYSGRFMKGKMHGRGKFTWSDGSTFEGTYVQEKKHGHGVFSWPNGSKIIGTWCDGQQHGVCTVVSSKGTERKGLWQRGKFKRWVPDDSLELREDATFGNDEDVVFLPQA